MDSIDLTKYIVDYRAETIKSIIKSLDSLTKPAIAIGLPDEYNRQLTSNSLGNDAICHHNFEIIRLQRISILVESAKLKLIEMYETGATSEQLLVKSSELIAEINNKSIEAYSNAELSGAYRGYRETQNRPCNDPNRLKL